MTDSESFQVGEKVEFTTRMRPGGPLVRRATFQGYKDDGLAEVLCEDSSYAIQVETARLRRAV